MSKTHYVTTNFLVDHVNYVLKQPDSTLEQREALIELLESALLEAGANRDYMYLTSVTLGLGVTPGVRYFNQELNWYNTDHTRRMYIYS
jgi:hypothetical protein